MPLACGGSPSVRAGARSTAHPSKRDSPVLAELPAELSHKQTRPVAEAKHLFKIQFPIYSVNRPVRRCFVIACYKVRTNADPVLASHLRVQFLRVRQ